MYLNRIYEEPFYGTKTTFSERDFSLSDKISTDELLKVSAYEVGALQEVEGEFIVDSSMFSVGGTKYPENALTVDLKKGEYVIAYLSGGLVSKSTGKVNSCIRCSALDRLDFGDFTVESQDDILTLSQESYLRVLADAGYSCVNSNVVKVTGKSKLHLWIDDETAVGAVSLKIFKVGTGKYEEKLRHSMIFTRSDQFSFTLPIGFKYQLVVSEIKEDKFKVPKFKYPVGTYQLTTYEKVGEMDGSKSIQELAEEDRRKLSLADGRLTSLENARIPAEVNPLNYYVMIGRVDLMIYIDFNNDEFYIRPSSYAEVFMNLFVPDREVTEVEITADYAIYNVVDYILISYDFRDKQSIMRSIKNWVSCIDSDIHADEYDLFYFISNFTLYDWYYARFKDIIDQHFTYIKLYPVTAVAYDNVETLQSSPDSTLDFTIVECGWSKLSSFNSPYCNVVDWNYTDNWQNTSVANEVKINVIGTAVLKISKKHFKNITGVSIDEATQGSFTDAQFRKFGLNYPVINPYNRLQYWLGIKL